jgi:hypothetical protein
MQYLRYEKEVREQYLSVYPFYWGNAACRCVSGNGEVLSGRD